VRFQVLGTLQVVVDDERPIALGGFRQRMVLAVLLLHAGQQVSVDALIDAVWGDAPPPTARKTLQVYVSRLRRVLRPGDIEAVPRGYVLRVDGGEIDAVRFETLGAEGRGLLEHDPVRAEAALRGALALWRGAPWGELGDQDALRADAERLRALKLEVLEDRLAADLALGRTRAVTAELGALVTEHPSRERLRGLLMTALYRDERVGEALRVFDEGRRWLADELGVDPGRQLQELHRRILAHDPVLSPEPPAVPAPVPSEPSNPFKGLRAFEELDAVDFHGRAALVRDLVARVASSPFVLLLGPSGCGKSSVVRAGLVPALRRSDGDAWDIVVMRPGAAPVAELERTLLEAVPALGTAAATVRHEDGLDLLRTVGRYGDGGAGRLLLVVDQFEELFLQAPAPERERFVRDLAEAVEDPSSPLTVVAVLRADLLGHPMAHPRLGPLVVASVVPVLPLAPAELEAACVAPAARVGVTLEPELAAELIAEVAGRAGALPLLQYTLTELFEHRRGHTITLADHRRYGGVAGVVARRAEETFASLDDDARAACRQLFLRLVTVGDEGEVARRRADRASLDVEGVEVVLDRFGSARLLAFDRDLANGATVEVAHEAVFRAWPRLRGWVDAAREDLRVQRSVAAAAAEWREADRADGYLLTGARLDTALAWLERASVVPTRAERAYLEASRAERERSLAADRARQERELALERRAARRLRALVAALTVAAVVAGSLGAVAATQRARSERRAVEARAAAELGRARELASVAISSRSVDPERSLLLALHAANIVGQAGLEVPADVVEALHWSLQAGRVPFPGDVEGVVVDGPDGRRGVFALPLHELVALARQHVGRDLTSAECADLFAGGACPRLPEQLPTLVAAEELAPSPDGSEPPLAGTRVTLIHTMGDAAGTGFQAALDAFAERSGVRVDQTSPADTRTVLQRALAEGTPPDVALLPWPAAVPVLARAGHLVPTQSYLDPDDLRVALSPHLLSLGTVGQDGSWPADDGDVYGIPVRVANKSVVWYSLPGFERAGYELPRDGEELLALTERMVADGHTPWCHGEGSGALSGWPGTDLVENLLLQGSVDDYDDWVAHRIPFDDPDVRAAFERMGQLLLRPGHVVGGAAAAARLEVQLVAAPLFDDPPGCLMYPQASFAAGWFPVGAEVGRDVGAFPFPPSAAGQDRPVLGSGDYVVAFADRPEVRALVRELTTTSFGEVWARHDESFLSPRADFPLDAYEVCDDDGTSCRPDPARAVLAPPLHQALADDRFRFDGSDLLAHEVGLEPMWEAMVDYVSSGPASIDRILTDLEATWDERERQAAG
jgi:DNA-binding SARP family transcriptional activator/ABC-type glycerol-3-phosphate transport system substrate-binding protein